MTFMTPSLSYQITAHVPLLQGDMPTLAVIRKSGDDHRLIRVKEVRGRSFHNHVMADVVEVAEKVMAIDKTAETHVHMVFSGQTLSGADIQELLRGRWPDESYSYISLAAGAQQAMLDSTDERLPFNQFKIPRMSIINAINYAYNEPGKIYFSLSADESNKLGEQLALFTERTATIPANDPDAILEHKGEGRVVAVGIALWHHFHARKLRAGFSREMV